MRTTHCKFDIETACDAELSIISDGFLELVAGMTSDVALKGKVT